MAIRKTLSLANAASENVNVVVCRNDNMKVIHQRSIAFAPDVNGNTWAQAYVALKQTEEFSGAEDC